MAAEGTEEEPNWINWWCRVRGNEFLVEVKESYIRDQFNLQGLWSYVRLYDEALDTILDSVEANEWDDETVDDVQSCAETLYGLIHARYITTTQGLQAMAEKYRRGDFGVCPRVHCEGQHVLPIGEHDRLGISKVKVFCPRCEDIYYPRSARQADMDGSFFGSTFPHLLLLCYPELQPQRVDRTKGMLREDLCQTEVFFTF
eukprot:Colp12_sorted_trinity150504_noHs@27851